MVTDALVVIILESILVFWTYLHIADVHRNTIPQKRFGNRKVYLICRKLYDIMNAINNEHTNYAYK